MQYDILAIGRSSIDLYSNDSGAPFEGINSFGAFVGGCPTNIAVGTRRLGLKSALLTAVGDDPVGKFILNFLNKEGVETKFVPVKPENVSSAVLLGIQPPDKFPLMFYRDNCADIQLTIDDVLKSPVKESKAILVSGTGLSAEPSRSATVLAVEMARSAGVKVIFDLDFRANQWADPRAFGVNARQILSMVDIVIGTQEEINAAMLTDVSQIEINNNAISDPTITGNVEENISALLAKGPAALVEKRGAEGAAVHLPDGEVITAAPFKVDIVNVLGAGDAFASGFIYGYLKEWDWQQCVRMGNATGAIVVTRQGCANFMPYEKETLDFIEANGGFVPDAITV